MLIFEENRMELILERIVMASLLTGLARDIHYRTRAPFFGS
jgi:hypothetical protein